MPVPSLSLTWPAVALILGLFALLLFKQPLTRLVDRVRKVGKAGFEADSSPDKQESKAVEKPSSWWVAWRDFDNKFLGEQEDLIRKDIGEKVSKTDAPERERALVRVLAATQIVMRFQGIYAAIYGTQLSALQSLNAAPDGLNRSAIEPFYKLGATLEPGLYAQYSFGQWLGFMQVNMLILVTGDQLQITVAGREFLKWIIESGLPLARKG